MAATIHKPLPESKAKWPGAFSDKATKNRTEKKMMFPRLIVKNHLGRTLNTSTSFQEAICKARLKVHETGETRTAIEWRLPHAPLPSRPDYSRTGPPWVPFARHRPLQQTGAENSPMNVQQTEFDVEDVSFVAKSLKALPDLPLLSFLHYDLFCEQKTYFQLAREVLMHKKILSATEKRHAAHVFPGFCTGCRRLALCRGCGKSSKSHYHKHKLARTGGGFTYFKQSSSAPTSQQRKGVNVLYQDGALKSLMRDYQSLFHHKASEYCKKVYSSSDLGYDNGINVDLASRGVVQIHPSWDNSSGSDDDSEEGIVADFGENDGERGLDPIAEKAVTPTSGKYPRDLDDAASPLDTATKESHPLEVTIHTESSTWEDFDIETGSFKFKSRRKKILKSIDPFSTDRVYHYNKGKPPTGIRSSKPTTKFVEFSRGGSGWKVPKKFIVRRPNRDPLLFWKPPKKRQQSDQIPNKPTQKEGENNEKDEEKKPALTPDSGLASEHMTELDYLRDQKLGTPEGGRRKSPVKKVKKEMVRERRQPIPPIEPELRQLTPQSLSFVREVQPSVRQDMIPEPPMMRKSSRELPPLEVPPLPKYIEDQHKSEKHKGRRRGLIEAAPEMKEPGKKLPPPPKVYNIPKQGSLLRRRDQPAEAPVTSKELHQMQDPLNFLAKYCIINPERLPYYEWVYQAVVTDHVPKYKRSSPSISYRNGVREASSESQLSPHEMNMLHDITIINRGQIPEKVGLSVSEQYLEKICYTLDMLQEKQRKMERKLRKMEFQKIGLMAERAREMFPEVTRVDYEMKAKKGKKGKKKKGVDPEPMQRPLKREEITDEVIVSRLDDKMIHALNKSRDLSHFDLAIDRTMEKLVSLETRLEHIEQEKKVLDLYCMECFFQGRSLENRPLEFKRQQSMLFQKLHPQPDFDIELNEIEGALQQINNNLLTNKELEYLYQILNLPGRRRLNFRLFSIVAALSEKVTQLDPILRKLLNKLDYNALNVKMSRCKELFSLLQDDEIVPNGNALASTLKVELIAGGMTPEHTIYVLNKFNRDGKGLVDFLDFVMYIPLFITIHERIVKDPLREELDL